MDAALFGFLSRLEPRLSETREWPTSSLAFDIETYIHDELPPNEYVTSVRALLLTDAGVAVLHNPDGFHILPGGRRNQDEPLLETLKREISEETGCSIADPVLMGFIHFHHRTPRPDGHGYPYPDFLQVVYAVRGIPPGVAPADPDGWEQRVEFMPSAELESRPLTESDRIYLHEGLGALGGGQ